MAYGISPAINISEMQTLIITMCTSHCRADDGGRNMQMPPGGRAGTELDSYHAMRVSSQMLLEGSATAFFNREIFKTALMCGTQMLCREAGFIHTHMKQGV